MCSSDLDASVKRDIAPTKVSGLGALRNVGLVEYRYSKQGADGHLHPIGFTAQDLQQHFPEAVSMMNSGKLGITRTALIPVLVKAIQEQQDQIEQLETRLAVLEAQNRGPN